MMLFSFIVFFVSLQLCASSYLEKEIPPAYSSKGTEIGLGYQLLVQNQAIQTDQPVEKNCSEKDSHIHGNCNCICTCHPVSVSIAPVVKHIKLALSFMLGCLERVTEITEQDNEESIVQSSRKGYRLRPCSFLGRCFGTHERIVEYHEPEVVKKDK